MSWYVRGIANLCTREHERRHFEDVVCPGDCKEAVAAVFPNGTQEEEERSECAAYGRGLECLRDSLAACGARSTCRKEIKDWAKDLHKTSILYYNCGARGLRLPNGL
jgi:hypothetical protein